MALATQRRIGADSPETTYALDVYFDYACPYAWAAHMWLDAVKQELGDRIDITWRIFPLEQVNAPDPDYRVWERPNDGTSATLRSFQAMHAARQQGPEAFERFHAAMFRKRHVEGRNLGRQPVLEAVAEEAGLYLDQFRADLASDAVFAEIERDFTLGQGEYGVFGTPTFVFDNGEAAYLVLDPNDLPEDPVAFFLEFAGIVRDRPNIREIKRPTPAR